MRLFAFLLIAGSLAACATPLGTPTAVSGLATPTPLAATATTLPTPCPLTAEVPMRFLALGDSYTIGESVSESERWPVQLVGLMREQGSPVEDPTIIARTGWTTDELAGALDTVRLAGPFDIVSLLIGVNNQYRGYDSDSYRTEFAALLQRAVGYTGGAGAGRVLVLSIPDWGVTPFAANSGRDPAQIAAEIDLFNAINRAETENAGARYVDITPGSRLAANDLTLIANDGLHPSGKMYAAWAQAALPVVCEMLNP